MIWVEGLARLEAKLELFREVYRILRQIGGLVFTDIVYANSDEDRPLKLRWTRRNRLQCPREYREMLSEIGFQEVRVLDVTSEFWTGFSKHIRTYFGIKALSGEID